MNANRRSLSHLIKQNSKIYISAYNKILFVNNLKKYLYIYTCTYVIPGQLYFSTKKYKELNDYLQRDYQGQKWWPRKERVSSDVLTFCAPCAYITFISFLKNNI